jgi:hypothetical protein
MFKLYEYSRMHIHLKASRKYSQKGSEAMGSELL